MAKLRDRKKRRYAVFASYMDGNTVVTTRCLDVFKCTFKQIKKCIDGSIYIGFRSRLHYPLCNYRFTSIKVFVFNVDNNQQIAYRKEFTEQ